MAHSHDTLLPQETSSDNDDQPGIAQPYSQSEIEDLLYGTDRPATERLASLRAMRDESAIRESGDWGDQDPASMLDELDRAIDELSATIANADDLDDDYPGLETGLDTAGDRLDTLSPDDVDAIDAIENGDALDDEDDADDLEPLDETEWQDDDDFKPGQGVE